MRLKVLPLVALSSVAIITACSKKNSTDNNAMNNTPNNIENAKTMLSSVKSLSTSAFVPDRIFYQFNDSSVTDEYKESLKLQVAYLKTKLDSDKAIDIIIEGNCDERGGVDYNMGLGQKRANSVKEFFIAQGISADRIKTVSFGKERKLVEGTSAIAYLQNRAAITKVSDSK